MLDWIKRGTQFSADVKWIERGAYLATSVGLIGKRSTTLNKCQIGLKGEHNSQQMLEWIERGAYLATSVGLIGKGVRLSTDVRLE
ncbi:hypothetical protein CEXT_318881 [Caerostris extrusa]|uniref:CRISPR-associated protein Cas6 C-terminal domain-containing protein n=1 Tax=Caerostris extrusa TaxID=172846 RepID=A0AAV4NB93_CAEEX|nr:hypothetical protein CEXT_318881 [Caerostris extrusa]